MAFSDVISACTVTHQAESHPTELPGPALFSPVYILTWNVHEIWHNKTFAVFQGRTGRNINCGKVPCTCNYGRYCCRPTFSIPYVKKLKNRGQAICLFEPCHEIMVLFVLRKLILQTGMRRHPVWLYVWFLVGHFVYFHTSCKRTANALTWLRESSLVAYVISTIISWAGSYLFVCPWVRLFIYKARDFLRLYRLLF